MFASIKSWPPLRTLFEHTVYAISGLPIALAALFVAPTTTERELKRAFASVYWQPETISDGTALLLGILLTPLAVPLVNFWFTRKNGPTIREREGKGLAAQYGEQLKLYFKAGIFGPWYYILSLHRDGSRRAPTFLQRCMTKAGIFRLLSPEPGSPLGDKRAFADRCIDAGLRCAPCEATIWKDRQEGVIPDADLFIKPLRGRGGKGAQRWDRVAPHRWSNGETLVGLNELLEFLRMGRMPLIVQRRVIMHHDLQRFTAGALPTVRVLTVLDERRVPEIAAAVFRMSMGDNRIVDNFHAGGIACGVALDSGTLGKASNLGSNAKLGWVSHHPDTGAAIEGARLPFWSEIKDLAERAHCAFSDRIMIGWDIGICDDGPILIEGNSGPDMDIMQRFMELGFCHQHRFSELLAHHLRARRQEPAGC